ncbi:hypothetical protein B0H16DRAFT_1464882 [Mycena metata]|uniref:Uncharacterized protein n=1 Tax=Mycena metata TaxID=1033252 RepID=A0AAD7IDH3_9AGAR|nr:hypothetical protein B0H16DRAFT_1464882 [Mycena metata]
MVEYRGGTRPSNTGSVHRERTSGCGSNAGRKEWISAGSAVQDRPTPAGDTAAKEKDILVCTSQVSKASHRITTQLAHLGWWDLGPFTRWFSYSFWCCTGVLASGSEGGATTDWISLIGCTNPGQQSLHRVGTQLTRLAWRDLVVKVARDRSTSAGFAEGNRGLTHWKDGFCNAAPVVLYLPVGFYQLGACSFGGSGLSVIGLLEPESANTRWGLLWISSHCRIGMGKPREAPFYAQTT